MRKQVRRSSSSDDWVVDAERTVAMLVLTAMHDIMKLECLLPTVRDEDLPFEPYKAGDTINDHDAALSFILERHPDALPSFERLSLPQQRILKFAQTRVHSMVGR